MAIFKRPENNARMKQMAQKLGMDLEQAVEDGQISRRELRQAGHHCGECAGLLECKIWFAAQQGENPTSAPNYCPNHGLYEKLRVD